MPGACSDRKGAGDASSKKSTGKPDAGKKPCKRPPCTKAEILKPVGSLDTKNDKSAWLAAKWRFDFQGVIQGVPGAYVLDFNGTVTPAPPYTRKWTLAAAAGTLQNDTTASPTHVPPASSGEGALKLVGMAGGKQATCKAQKKVKIYEDHLARDKDNFGTGISCDMYWSFTKFGATIDSLTMWNCHGSTRHLYDSSGNGSAGPGGITHLVQARNLKKTVTVTHKDAGGGTHPALGTLNRGDVVAYYTATGALAHTQTCTGNGTETYGANNKPLSFPGKPGPARTGGNEAYEWATSPAGDWANNVKKGLKLGGAVITPFTIKVFSKP